MPANESRKIAVKWSTDANDLTIKDLTEDLSNSASFDGAFTLASYLKPFFGNKYPMWLKNIKLYDKVLSDATIEREALR